MSGTDRDEFDILFHRVFTEDAVRVAYSRGIRVQWEASVERFIDEAWSTYVLRSKSIGLTMYDGHVLRLDGYDGTEDRLILHVSDVCFRSCIGTGTDRFLSTFPHAPRANPLTVSIVLVTADGQIILEKRSRIDERRRTYHVIAGYMEREFDVKNNHVNAFDCVRREVHEELGVLLGAPIYATGLVRAVYGSELCFCGRLAISFGHLVEIRADGQTDTEIDMLEGLEDTPSAVGSFVANHINDCVPTGRACLLLYGRVAYGESWYKSVTGAR